MNQAGHAVLLLGFEVLQAARKLVTSAVEQALFLTVGWYAGTVTLVAATQEPASDVGMLPSPVGVVPVSPVGVVPVSRPPSSLVTPVSTGAELSFSVVVPLSVPAELELLLEQPAVRAKIDAVMRRRRVMGRRRTALQRPSPGDLLNGKSQSNDAGR
jgi:hypothetical protein